MSENDIILKTIMKIHETIKTRNTITEQEFVREEFAILFNEELIKSTSEEKLFSISERFTIRFSLFDPITVVDSLGQTVLELAPSAISPNSWNKASKDNLGNKYKVALEHSNALIRKDLEVKEEMMDAINNSTDASKLAKWIMFKKDIELKYSHVFTSPEAAEIKETDVTSDEINETPTKLTINSSDLF